MMNERYTGHHMGARLTKGVACCCPIALAVRTLFPSVCIVSHSQSDFVLLLPCAPFLSDLAHGVQSIYSLFSILVHAFLPPESDAHCTCLSLSLSNLTCLSSGVSSVHSIAEKYHRLVRE